MKMLEGKNEVVEVEVQVIEDKNIFFVGVGFFYAPVPMIFHSLNEIHFLCLISSA